ncbi:hypothetical protein ESA94_02630 [Lacibacter luteus]|uniref:Uncharacterized protein n=1 Tax=Lacibacter luteus TaxID=2508719 RepID=A0A4Q1CMG7_9BACT|nr:hypothetical protein [Lacibacter luteus]RXK61925.1 hypothetical protein ESA94_02630 [Lacibacter luteus]
MISVFESMGIYSRLLFCCLYWLVVFAAAAQTHSNTYADKKQQALSLVKQITLTKSNSWPNVNPDLFLANLKRNIERPVFLYAGRNTNFCSYAAVGYILLEQDPSGYVQFMLDLYTNGEALYANTTYKPAEAVRKTAGTILYEGELDRNDADQVFFFTLADHYKGYLNILHLKYKRDGELGLWAATNLAKFNRMLRAMMQTEIRCIGYDLVRVKQKHLVDSLQKKLAQGDVFLYLNNGILRKKNHNKVKKHIPTHYVVLKSIVEENGHITMTYWDAGFTTQRQIDTKALYSMLFGISWSVRHR